MKRRGVVALGLLGFAITTSLIYYFVFRGSTPELVGSCQALHPYKSVCHEEGCVDTEGETGVCGLDPCKESVRIWSYTFLLAIFTGSLGGADFYMGHTDSGYKKLYLGVFSIIGLDAILLLLIIISKLIPSKHRTKLSVKRAYTVTTYILSLLVGCLIGFLIILLVNIVSDIYTLYFHNRVDINKCPLI